MKAIILVAGEGKRLRPLTWFIPKPLIKIKGKAVIDRIIEYLNLFGITQIIVNLHYKPEKFRKHLGSRVLYFYEKHLLGEEGTLRALSGWMDDFTVVVNGDTLTNLNLVRMLEMSGGNAIRFMDKNLYAGLRIIPPHYQIKKEMNYFDPSAWWCDMGTWRGLLRANRLADEKLSSLWGMRN